MFNSAADSAGYSLSSGSWPYNFDGAGAIGKPPDIATFLEARYQTVNTRFGCQTQGIAHLIK
jgi:hypothetical protein